MRIKPNFFSIKELKQIFILIASTVMLLAWPSRAATGDSTDRLIHTRLFEQPLIWSGQTTPTETESSELWDAFGIERHQKLDDSVNDLEAFLTRHPHSAWAPSLHANLGQYYHERGYCSAALSHWQAAWDASGNMTDSSGKGIADYALAHQLRLLCSLGRTDTVKMLLDQTRGRKLIGPLQQMYNQSQEAYGVMLSEPGISYRCGTYALGAVVGNVYRTNNMEIMTEPSPQTGFSMAMLVDLAQKNHYDFVAVQRPEGDGRLVVPSVVHWKQNHYAAILAQNGDRYEVADPTFRLNTWLTADAINAESSGQFIIPAQQVPASWKRLSAAEAGQIFGKGYTFNFDDPGSPPGPPAPPGPPPPPPPPCPTPPPGSEGVGGNGNSPSCSSCGSGPTGAMPDWMVLEPYDDLWVKDEPLAYQPATGPRISLQIEYWQRDDVAVDPVVFGLGPGWNCSWLSYIDKFDNAASGSPVTLYPAGGGQRQYKNFDGTQPDYFTNTRMIEDTNSSGNVIDFRLIYPSGAVDVYGFLRTNLTSTISQAFLSQKIDAHGRTTAFIYAPFDPASTAVKLIYVVDADGVTNTISYTNVDNVCSNLISGVTDPYQRSVIFEYDENGYLTNSTDVAGISSSFSYGDYHWMINMTTPNGTTSFQFTDQFPPFNGGGGPPDDASVSRSVIVTQPNGGHQMFIFRENCTYVNNSNVVLMIPASYSQDVPTNPPTGSTLDNVGYMHYRNSFYWGPQQFANLSAGFLATAGSWDFNQLSLNDYTLARLRHWNHSLVTGHTSDSGSLIGDSLSMERNFSPDGQKNGKMTWYDYLGRSQPYYYMQGTTAFPSLVIKLLPDGSQWYQQYQMDQFGNRTNVISTYSAGGQTLLRTNSYVYASNGQDLLLSIGPDGVTNAAYAYDANHQVLFMTNALGEVTSYTYNGDEQVTSITGPNGLVTTNIYDGNGYLVQETVVGFSTNSYTYTNGLVYTHTDPRGLTVTNAWDALNRLIKTTYPDGTYVSYTYSNLNLIQVTDRMGFSTTYGYNAIGQKIAETNALGNPTFYTYCECGALNSVSNALGQATYFSYDNQGNLIETLYADGYSVTNGYDPLRRLTARGDSGGAVLAYTYNNQGLIIATSNNVGLVSASAYDINDRVTNSVDANGVSVNMTYDNLGRILTRSYPDGGVEHYGYTPDISGPTSYTNQIGNGVLYAYDLMDRKTNEVFVGVTTNKFAYSGASDLLALTDGKNQTTAWNYDAFGRVTNKLDAASNTNFIYQYDPDNRLTNRWTPAEGNTVYSYDSMGNLTHIGYPTSPSISLAYDELNRLTNMVDAVGTTLYSYDAVGQLISEDGPWSNDTVSYSYANRLRTALILSEPGGAAWTNSYTYDSIRRLASVTSPAGTFSYSVFLAPCSQLPTSLMLPNGAYITNSYDSMARLTATRLESAVQNYTNGILDSYVYGYNQAGQRTNVVRLSGDSVSYSYDNAGELKTAVGQESGGTSRLHEQFGYVYDAAGNLNYRTNNALIQAFEVNNLNELTFETNGGTLTVVGTTTIPATNVTVNGSIANLYADATFALAGFTISNGWNTYTAIGRNSAGDIGTNTVSVNLPGTNNYSYDLNGNLLSDGTRNFGYDDENELISVWVANTWSNSFAYDGQMRRRIERDYTWGGSSWIQANEIRYIYDGDLVAQERNSNNVLQVTYTRGNDLSGTLQGAGGIGGLLARTDTNATAFYHADGNGNITCLVYTNQTIAAKYLYDPFGNMLVMSSPLAAGNVYRFSSKEWDSDSGLYYYTHRFYDPNLQRWPNRDPIQEFGGLNLYGFVGNNPINQDDALGLCNIKIRCGPVALGFVHCGIVVDGTEYGLHGDQGLPGSRPSSGSGATLFGPGGRPPAYVNPTSGPTPGPNQTDYSGNIPGSCECAKKCLQNYINNNNPGPPYGAISGPNSDTYAHNMLNSCGGTVNPIPYTVFNSPRRGGPTTVTTTTPPGAINW